MLILIGAVMIFFGGLLLGYVLWGQIPPPLHVHYDCDERFTRMSQKYKSQIHDLNVEIARLIEGQS